MLTRFVEAMPTASQTPADDADGGEEAVPGNQQTANTDDVGVQTYVDAEKLGHLRRGRLRRYLPDFALDCQLAPAKAAESCPAGSILPQSLRRGV